jgi:hypothetical protein
MSILLRVDRLCKYSLPPGSFTLRGARGRSRPPELRPDDEGVPNETVWSVRWALAGGHLWPVSKRTATETSSPLFLHCNHLIP